MNRQITLNAAFVQQATRIANTCPKDSTEIRGMGNADVKRVLTWAHEGACEFVGAGLDAQQVASITPIKGVMRLAQAVGFVAGNMQRFEPSTAFVVACIALAKQKTVNYQDVRFLMGGTGSDDTAAIKGVSRARLQRFIGSVSEGTRATRVSSALGANGFLSALGVAAKSGKHSFDIINASHPFIVAYAMRLENMGDQTFELLTAE